MNLDDYVDVAERIRMFKERYPDGSLQSHEPPRLWQIGDKTFVGYCAAAYRTPDDARPGVGWAWEPVPGPTPFTRDSELMNAETSAWGRAIVALGFETKKIASANEVQNRTADREDMPPATEQMASKGQMKEVTELLMLLEAEAPHNDPSYNWTSEAQAYCKETFGTALRSDPPSLTKAQMEQLRVEMERRLTEQRKALEVPFG